MALILKGRAKLKGSTVIGKRPYAIDGVFNPELVLDFQKEFYRTNSVAKTFPNAITHTRASTATYVDSTGTLQTAAVNEPRLGHHVYNGTAWVNEGLLHESEARTNLLVQSEVVDDDAVWTDNGSTSTNLTDGALGVWDGVSIASSGAGFHRLNADNFVSVTSGDTLTFRAWVKEGTSGRLRINLQDVSDGPSSTVQGSFGSLAANQDSIGAITSVKEEDFGNGTVAVSGTITVNFTGELRFGIGPDSAVAGETVIAYAAQLEAAPTVSSYIPTAGTTVTRSADVLTIPAANLPYPEPVVIGPEIADGDGSSATGWASPRANSTLSSVNGRIRTAANTAAAFGVVQEIATEVGKVYVINFSVVANNTTNGFNPALRIGGNLSLNSFYINTSVNFSDFIFVARDTTTYLGVIGIAGAAGEYLEVDNISVREINPLALSIQMDGRVTYADEDTQDTVRFVRWFLDGSNSLFHRLDTNSGSGEITFIQTSAGVFDTAISGGSEYSPDILVPFNIAGRHGSTFINGAIDGTALTANTTPTSLPDLSSTDLNLGFNYNGTIRTFRIWAQDIGDAGLVEATEPSLVPSLSLTFDGTENSFIVNDWTS